MAEFPQGLFIPGPSQAAPSAASTVGSTAASTASSTAAGTLLGPAMIMFQILSALRGFNQGGRQKHMQEGLDRDRSLQAAADEMQRTRDIQTLRQQYGNIDMKTAAEIYDQQSQPQPPQQSALSQFGVPSVSSAGKQMAGPGGQFGMPNVSPATPTEGSGVGKVGPLARLNQAKQSFDLFGMFNKKKDKETPMQQFDMPSQQPMFQNQTPQDPYVSQVGRAGKGLAGGSGQSAVGKLRSDMDLVRQAMSKGSYSGRI